MSKQPEALRVAAAIESHVTNMDRTGGYVPTEDKAAALLRSQHALIAELSRSLEDALAWLKLSGMTASMPFMQQGKALLIKAKEQQQ